MLKATLALAGALVSLPVLAASPFDGTWKTDIAATKYSAKPRTILYKDGMYQCDCTPPIHIKADGTLQKLTGNDYVDEMSIKVIDGHHAKAAYMKGGKSSGDDLYTLSPDGKTLKIAYTDTTAPDGRPVTGVTTLTRTAPAPAGSLPLSGAYVKSGETMSADALTFMFKVDATTFHFATANGFAFDAPLDGKAVPIKGDPAGAIASVRKTGPRTYVETDTIGGKPQSVTTMTLRPDGRTLDVTAENLLSKRTTNYVVRKQ